MSLLQKAIEIHERGESVPREQTRAPDSEGMLKSALRLVTEPLPEHEEEEQTETRSRVLNTTFEPLASEGAYRGERIGAADVFERGEGLLAKAMRMREASAAREGLLERAIRSFEQPSETGASLYARAAEERARLEAEEPTARGEPTEVDEEDRRDHRETVESILQKPTSRAREPWSEEEEEPPVPAPGEIDMLGEVESLGGEIDQSEPAAPLEPAAPGEAVEGPPSPGEPAAGEEPAAPGQEEAEALPAEQFAAQVRDYLAGGRTVDLLTLFSSVQQEKGHQRFSSLLAEAFTTVGEGTGTLLFTAHRDRYELETRHDGPGPVPSWRKKTFRKKSPLARFLREQGRILSSDEEPDREVAGDLASFAVFEPFVVAPIQVGEELAGFAVITGLEDTPPVHHVSLLANVAALNLYSYVLEKNLQESVDRLIEENRELVSIMDLYRYGELGSMSLDGVLAAAARNFEIESAVITGNWEGRGSVTVLASLGISDKGVKKYRAAKSDKELKGVIKKGEPAVLGGIDDRLSMLPEQDRQGMNTFVAAPVLFDGRTLAVLMVHRMKGVNRHLTGRQAGVIRNIAQSLVPFLLYKQIVEMEPFEVFESLLEREASLARKARASLHVVAFRIKNYKSVITSQGFKKYRQRLDRFCTRISKTAAGHASRKGAGKAAGDRSVGVTARIVALNKVVLLLRDRDQDRVNRTIKQVKDAVKEMVSREKTKIPLSYTPMRTVYPNDSKSVADIIQVIE